MTIQSMTGFGRGEAFNSDYTLTVEIKSVNHRYRDFRWRSSSLFSQIELQLKNRLLEKFRRGSFDISIHYARSEENNKFDELDQQKIEIYLERMKGIADSKNIALQVNPTDFLRQEFYQERDSQQEEEMKSLAVKAFDIALVELEKSRKQEGEKLLAILLKHQEKYLEIFNKVLSLSQSFKAKVEERLRKRFEEYQKEIAVEEDRFLQEVIYYLEKLDVSEETDRIKAHFKKMDHILTSPKEVGREIDFLVQELNRETNTIGSKSADSDISQCVVEMKVQLEKIREQGLNIE